MLQMRKLRAAVALAAVVAVACGEAGDEAATTTTAATVDTTTATTAGEAERPTITLEDPGAEPRQALRFQVQEGDVSEAVLTMAMSSAMEADGETLQQPQIPPIQITVRSEVTEVDDDADTITMRFSYAGTDIVDDGTVDPQTAEQLRSSLSVMDQLSGTATVTSRGEPVSNEFDVPDELDPNSRQMVEQVAQQVETLTVPLPEEVVGVGAIWRVSTTSSVGGIDTVLDLTYELKELDGTRLVLAVAYEQTAPPQEANFQGAPEGTVAEIQEYLITGEGELVAELSAILPTTSTITAGGDVAMQLKDETQSVDLRQRLDLDIRLESTA